MDSVVKALVEQYGVSVSLDVAAPIVGFSEDKVRELRRAGRFPGRRAGTKVMVFVPELVEWMRNGGEAQYEPTPTSAAGRQPRPPRRGADRPEWMDRVPPVPPPEERHQRLRTPGSPNSATSRSVRYSSGSSIPFEKWEPYFFSVKMTE